MAPGARLLLTHRCTILPGHAVSLTMQPQCRLATPSLAPQVIYSHAQAKALHHAPLFIVLLLPLLGEVHLLLCLLQSPFRHAAAAAPCRCCVRCAGIAVFY